MAAHLQFMMPLDSMASLSPVKNILFLSHLQSSQRERMSQRTWSISMTLAGVRMAEETAAVCSFIGILTRTRPMNTQPVLKFKKALQISVFLLL